MAFFRRSYHRHQPKSGDALSRRTTRRDDATTEHKAKVPAEKTTDTQAKALAEKAITNLEAKALAKQTTTTQAKALAEKAITNLEAKALAKQTTTTQAKALAKKTTNTHIDDDYDLRLHKANHEGK